MCGIVGYTGPREAGPILIEGLQAARVPRLRLGRDRPRRRGRRPVRREAGRQAREPPDRDRRPDAARGDRARPHALGDPRPAERPQRPSPPGLHRRHHGHPQRDHRELPRAPRRPRGARPHADVRDRHGGDRPPRRGGLRRATSPTRSGPRSASSRAPTRSSSCTGARSAGSSAPARTCRSSSGSARRGELHRQRRRRDPRPHEPDRLPRGGRRRRRPADRRRDHRHRRRAARAGRDDRSTGRPRPPRRAATSISCSRRSTSSPRRSASRSPAGSPATAGSGSRSSSALADDAPERRPGRARRLRQRLLRVARRRRRAPGLDGPAGPGDRRLGVPLQPAAARRQDARHRGHPVGRDGRHDRPDPPRPRAGLPDHRGHEHRRLGDHPRGGRGRLPPGRARRSRSPPRRRS